MKKFLKKMEIVIVLLFLLFTVIVQHYSMANENLEVGSWDVEVDDRYGNNPSVTATYTIKPGDVNSDGTITIDCGAVSKQLAYLINEVSYNQTAWLNLTIKNESGVKISYSDYEFTTKSLIDYGDLINTNYAEPMKVETIYNYDYLVGNVSRDIVESDGTISGTVNVQGFDNKNIRFCFVPCRNRNKALLALIDNNTENFVVTKVQEIDEMVKQEINVTDINGNSLHLNADPNRTYGEYVKAFYNRNTFDEFSDEELADFFFPISNISGYDGLENRGTSNISKPGQKFLAVDAEIINNSLINDNFKTWGFTYQHSMLRNRGFGSFFMFESDPEVQAAGYKYVYSNILRFSFDDSKYKAPSEEDSKMANEYGLLSYINKDSKTTEMVNDILEDQKIIEDGESINLPNAVIRNSNPNAYNQARSYDFGFSLEFKTEKQYERNVELIKKDSKTGYSLQGVRFKFQKQEGQNWVDYTDDTNNDYTNLVTDENGKIVVNSLREGMYRFVETKPLANYKDEELVREFEIKKGEDNSTLKLELFNTKEYRKNVHLYKFDTDTKSTIGGELFKLLKKIDGEYVLYTDDTNIDYSNLQTNEEGSIDIINLPVGEYKIVEITTLDGYLDNNGIEREFIISEEEKDETINLRLENSMVKDLANETDEEKKEESKEETEEKSTFLTNPKTGDQIIIYCIIFISASLVLLFTIIVRKKGKKYRGKH